MIKRLFDFTFAFLGVIVLMPIFALIGVLIRYDSPGTIFYKCIRVGKNGRPFGMYKFRTMNDGLNGANPKVTAQDDPRITRIGRVLRQTKLNEFPQLFNVLRGEMSLVGPRPEDPEFVAHYSSEERQILSVRPGITSPASILYRNEEEMLHSATVTESYLTQIMPDKLRLDLLYVRHHSFLLDLDVLLRTFAVLLPLFRDSAPDIEEILLGPVQKLIRKHIPWFILDAVIAFVAIALAGLIWRAARPLDVGLGNSILLALGFAFLFSLVNWLMSVQRTAWQYASLSEMMDIALSSGMAMSVLVFGNYFLLDSPLFPSGMLILAGCFACFGFTVSRYRTRLLQGTLNRWQRLTRSLNAGRERVIIVGGGETGQFLLWRLKNSAGSQALDIIGIVDDDLWKRGARIHGVKVLGSRFQIPKIVKEHEVNLIVFAIHNISAAERESILSLCGSTPARVVLMPVWCLMPINCPLWEQVPSSNGKEKQTPQPQSITNYVPLLSISSTDTKTSKVSQTVAD